MELALNNADRALYWSKKHGKNCVTVWSDIKENYTQEE